MRRAIRMLSLALFFAALPAQAPPAQPNAAVRSSDLGFAYKVPDDWELLSAPATMAQAKSEASQNAGSEEEKKGVACLELVLTARDPKSGSILSVEALPFACFGHQMTDDDLQGFAAAGPEALKENFDLGKAVSAGYALGTHKMWIERAPATLKNHPEFPVTIEITCGLLKKAAVCWMAVTGNNDALRAFEGGKVTLDGESPAALVPPTAFDTKPS